MAKLKHTSFHKSVASVELNDLCYAEMQILERLAKQMAKLVLPHIEMKSLSKRQREEYRVACDSFLSKPLAARLTKTEERKK